MLDLDNLRDRLDNMLSKETVDSLNEWLNNKRTNMHVCLRDMNDEQIARVQLVGVLDDIQSMMHELTLDEMDELIDKLTLLYEQYNGYVDAREEQSN